LELCWEQWSELLVDGLRPAGLFRSALRRASVKMGRNIYKLWSVLKISMHSILCNSEILTKTNWKLVDIVKAPKGGVAIYRNWVPVEKRDFSDAAEWIQFIFSKRD
jgi:hypothetical protein